MGCDGSATAPRWHVRRLGRDQSGSIGGEQTRGRPKNGLACAFGLPDRRSAEDRRPSREASCHHLLRPASVSPRHNRRACRRPSVRSWSRWTTRCQTPAAPAYRQHRSRGPERATGATAGASTAGLPHPPMQPTTSNPKRSPRCGQRHSTGQSGGGLRSRS